MIESDQRSRQPSQPLAKPICDTLLAQYQSHQANARTSMTVPVFLPSTLST